MKVKINVYWVAALVAAAAIMANRHYAEKNPTSAPTELAPPAALAQAPPVNSGPSTLQTPAAPPASAGGAAGCSIQTAAPEIADYARVRAQRLAELDAVATATRMPSRPGDSVPTAAQRFEKLRAGEARIDRDLEKRFSADISDRYRSFMKRCGARASP